MPSITTLFGRAVIPDYITSGLVQRQHGVTLVEIMRYFIQRCSKVEQHQVRQNNAVLQHRMARCAAASLNRALWDAMKRSGMIKRSTTLHGGAVCRDAMRRDIMMRQCHFIFHHILCSGNMNLSNAAFSGGILYHETLFSGSLCSDSTRLHKTMRSGMIASHAVKQDGAAKFNTMVPDWTRQGGKMLLDGTPFSGSLRRDDTRFHVAVLPCLCTEQSGSLRHSMILPSGKLRCDKTRQSGITIPYVTTRGGDLARHTISWFVIRRDGAAKFYKTRYSGLTTHCSTKLFRALHNLAASQIDTSRNGTVPHNLIVRSGLATPHPMQYSGRMIPNKMQQAVKQVSTSHGVAVPYHRIIQSGLVTQSITKQYMILHCVAA